MPQLTTSPVTSSHNGAPSPTSASNVGDESTTSVSHVDNPHPSIASYVGGTTLVTTSLINVTFPTSIHHVGDASLASSCFIEIMSPAIVNNIGVIEKPQRLRHKPKFLCRTCKGDHLTHLCLAIAEIPEARGSPKGPSDYEASVVFPHPVPPFIDLVVMPLQFPPDLTTIF